MELNGKKVFKEWDPALPIGTLYTSDVVDDFMNCLPPACLTSRCAQLGEPYSHEFDNKAGQFRPVFITFTRVTAGKNGIWKYCGKCFQGEIEEPNALKTWKFKNGVMVEERYHNHDLHSFCVNHMGRFLGVIFPSTIEDMRECFAKLDMGKDPISDGWEDGCGHACTMEGW